MATSSAHRSPAALAALALLCATAPGVVRAQQDTLFIPAQPVSAAIVPDLSGRTVQEARALLAEQKLEVGAIDEVVASGLAGTVARQQPAPGVRVEPGSAIPLWIVAARVTVMPAIMGLPPERALRLVRQAGLRQGEVSGWNEPGPIRVIGHSYRAGERVPANAVVNLALGIPPAPRVARADTPAATVAKVDSGAVPDVRTMDLATARTALQGAGLAAAFDSAFADSAGWTVATQAPEAGALVPVGSLVQLAFAAPAPPPAAPVAAAPVVTTFQPAPATPPPPPVADGERGRTKLWIALAVALLAAAGAGAWRMGAGKAAPPPVPGVRVALRTDVRPRSSVAGPPLGLPRLKLRLREGMPVSRVATSGPLFRAKGGAG